MSKKKTVLILTDEAAPVISLSNEIAKALSGFNVVVKTASVFDGTDLLPAGCFFIGCQNPNPPSFSYIETMLKHINLSGRICGVFSAGDKGAVNYLKELLADSEVTVYSAGENKDLAEWAQETANRQ